MTEAEWLASTDPRPMLEFLKNKASDRKSRLFAVACCRRIWNLLLDPASRAGVETAKRYADGSASEAELRAASASAWEAVWTVWPLKNAADEIAYGAAKAAAETSNVDPRSVLRSAAEAAHTAEWAAVRAAPLPVREQIQKEERAAQANLLREVFGLLPLFTPTPTIPAPQDPTGGQ